MNFYFSYLISDICYLLTMLNDIENLSYNYHEPKQAYWVITKNGFACGVYEFTDFKLAKETAKAYIQKHTKLPLKLSHNCINIQYVGTNPFTISLLISLAPILHK